MIITEQLLLTKWQSLDIEKKAEVWALIDKLSENSEQDNNKLIDYLPKTKRGKKLWALRQEIVKKSGVKLLDWDEIEAEMNDIRGKE
ncbi:hypothetical protein Cyast_1958 [Cyanobacterium stanieri PCC 7202]|uniref:Uncharacterized protein n=1 Tax=Cyanobacterium stanieri (strain ATCC 29140 / PCC 7202) TaxID=292563 RepID=K9YLV5_CYASC|nr:hypothetical protein Cyast_1958 [Cyanobacterium stanieri PCC 7202]